MNFVDLFLVLVILLGVFSGWQKGFILSVADLVILAGSVICGFLFYSYLGAFLEKHMQTGVWTLPLSFILVMIFSRIILSVASNQLLKVVPTSTHKDDFNRFLGIIPGLINGLINALVLAALLLALP